MKALLDIADTWSVGAHLRRPECVLCLADGSLLTSHLGAGAVRIAPDGTQRVIGSHSAVDGEPWIPNGLALLPEGDLLVANMGPGGGLWRLRPDGQLLPELRAVDGVQLGATNFVLADGSAGVWISISTHRWPISEAFSPGVADGYIVRLDARGARIVAEGLGFANELRLDGDGRHLYVAETFAHRVSRFPIEGSELRQRETFADLGQRCFPDGMAFDAKGHLWAASIISNQVLRIAPDGEPALILDDSDAAELERIERRIAEGCLKREDVQSSCGSRFSNISSIAFGGKDLQTGYLGSLAGDQLIAFRSPVPGLPPQHWNHPHTS